MNSYRKYKFCEHFHADRGGIAFELILELVLKLIIVIIIMLKNRNNLSFLMACRKALPALSWTYKCEYRLEM